MPEAGSPLSTPLSFLFPFNPDELILRFKNVLDKSICLSFTIYRQFLVHEVTLAVLSFLHEPFFLKQTDFLRLVGEEVIIFYLLNHFPITSTLNSLLTPTVIGPDIRFDCILTLCRGTLTSLSPIPLMVIRITSR